MKIAKMTIWQLRIHARRGNISPAALAYHLKRRNIGGKAKRKV